MMNLSLYELRQIANGRNISDYENKSKKDLKKAIIETKPEPKPKPDTKSEPKLEIRINKKKLKELRKDFDELRHKFSKTEIKRYRKAFYIAKNYKYLSKSEIKKINKNFNKLKKSLRFKKIHGNIDSVDYEDRDNYNDN